MPKKKQPRQQTLEAVLGQPRLRDTVARRAVAGGSSPSVQTSSPRHHAPPSSAPTAFSHIQNRSSPLKSTPQNVVTIESSSEEEAEGDSRRPFDPLFDDEEEYRMLSNGSSKPRHTAHKSPRGLTIRTDGQDLRSAGRSSGKSQVVVSDSDDDDLPLLSSKSTSKKLSVARGNLSIGADDECEDDDDVFSPRKTRRARQAEASDSDDKPLVTPLTTNRLKRRVLVLVSSDEEELEQPLSSPTKRRRLVRRGGASSPVREDTEQDDELTLPPPPPSPIRRKPRTEKEKARELLRRKRAGEVINEEEEDDEEEEDVRPLYDPDPDHLVLHEFLDDDEEVPEIPRPVASPKKKSPRKKKGIESGSDSDLDVDVNGSGDEESEDDFVVPDDNIGVPDHVMAMIPLQFTAQAHRPLRDHFGDVIEWLVQYRINPGYTNKPSGAYAMGWQKLDDEVRALAESKFASSAWRPDFYKALRARPEFTTDEIGPMETNFGAEKCSACGRSNHPARHLIKFGGAPYHKSFSSDFFLQPVELAIDSESDGNNVDNDDEDDRDDDHDGSDQVPDEDGNMIEPEDKTWLIGSVCNSNAKDAHRLIHWKYALLSWVDANLEQGGYMTPEKVKKRLKMSAIKNSRVVQKILAKWAEDDVIRLLFKSHKDDIEESRNKNTPGRYMR